MLSIVNCRFHCSSPGVITLLVSLSLVVSGMCCSLVGSQLLQSPLTAASLTVLLDGGPLGVQHFFSVFPEESDGTICAFSLATRCSWCSAGVLEGSVTWSHLSVSPPFVALFVPCAAGMRCGHGCSLWPQGVRAALRVGRLTSNCSTERHSTVPHEANWLQWHLRVRATRASAKCLLRGRSSEASSSPWHGSRVMPERYSVGLVQETHWGCGACGVAGYWKLGDAYSM